MVKLTFTNAKNHNCLGKKLLNHPNKMDFLRRISDCNKGNSVDVLVQEIRQQVQPSIQQRCGMIQVLDTSLPIDLNSVSTKVKILEHFSECQHPEVSQLLYFSVLDRNKRPVSRINQNRVLGLDAVKRYPRLIVFGNSGAGKTTFLKHLAIQCCKGELQANLVPIFIALREFTETEQPSLLAYIYTKLRLAGIEDDYVTQLLNQGKMLFLLDGIDEVKEVDSHRVWQEVKRFTTEFYTNQFVITCRSNSDKCSLKQFTQVEVTAFDDEQIVSFANKWFVAPQIGNRFIQKVSCNSSIQEVATNPLLLTLLCLVFEESGDFPLNRSEIYQEGLNILLKKWQRKHHFEQEQIYKKLSIHQKEDLLSQIALLTFEQDEYFIKQQEIKQYIADYICNLPNISTEIEFLQLESEAILNAIASQHGLLLEQEVGIYSFSHLMFHEYFTAREIIGNSNPFALDTALKQLTSHITECRWREVFLLTVNMLRNPYYLLQLMKQKIDNLIAEDEQLQAFITWVSQKVKTGYAPYKPVAIRAFYFDLAIAHSGVIGNTPSLTKSLDSKFTPSECNLALDFTLDQVLILEQVAEQIYDPNSAFEGVLESAIAYAQVLEPMLEQALQQLKDELSQLDRERNKFWQWWKANGKAWTEQLRNVMIQHRQIGHNWQFSQQQKETLKQYYNANLLLIDCLNNSFYVTLKMRSEIESTLLLPTTNIS